MGPQFFEKPADFRKWLLENHAKQTELLVGFYKVNSGKPSITWPQSVDEALCFGWIDGIRKSIDDNSYTIRFTPRKKSSVWSAVNIKKFEELTNNGLMRSSGLAAYQHRKEAKSKIYSYENEELKLSKDFEQKFKSNEKAWDFFSMQAPWYKKTMIYWIMNAKQESTRLARLHKTITESENLKKMR